MARSDLQRDQGRELRRVAAAAGRAPLRVPDVGGGRGEVGFACLIKQSLEAATLNDTTDKLTVVPKTGWPAVPDPADANGWIVEEDAVEIENLHWMPTAAKSLGAGKVFIAVGVIVRGRHVIYSADCLDATFTKNEEV
jgi:hypothetical protein